MANRIKELRIQSNISYKQLSDFLGATEQDIKKLEDSELFMTTVQLRKLCTIFCCSEAQLLGIDTSSVETIDCENLDSAAIASIAAILKIVQNNKDLNALLSPM